MLGLDYASIDSDSPPDFNATKSIGVGFLYIRRCTGLVADGTYLRDSQRARDAGLVVGAYFAPHWGANAPDAKSQVAAFKAAAGDIIPGTDLPPAIDVEFNGGAAAQGISKAELLEQVHQMFVEMQLAFGCPPVIYTSYGQYFDLGCPTMLWAPACPLWVKTAYRLPARQHLDTVTPPIPHSGDVDWDHRSLYQIPNPWAPNRGWLCQQYQGDAVGVPGFSSTVDVNRFNTVTYGSSGAHVRWLQTCLGCDVTGVCDAQTIGAIKTFQVAHGLTADGIAGPRTMCPILWAP